MNGASCAALRSATLSPPFGLRVLTLSRSARAGEAPLHPHLRIMAAGSATFRLRASATSPSFPSRPPSSSGRRTAQRRSQGRALAPALSATFAVWSCTCDRGDEQHMQQQAQHMQQQAAACTALKAIEDDPAIVGDRGCATVAGVSDVSPSLLTSREQAPCSPFWRSPLGRREKDSLFPLFDSVWAGGGERQGQAATRSAAPILDSPCCGRVLKLHKISSYILH